MKMATKKLPPWLMPKEGKDKMPAKKAVAKKKLPAKKGY
jgi:hypothetical protein